ncbi:sensor domain-containing diguanylate cyclase [Metabacillus lacus]|nr:diguanylate cyclase [Metabacillus lacus]
MLGTHLASRKLEQSLLTYILEGKQETVGFSAGAALLEDELKHLFDSPAAAVSIYDSRLEAFVRISGLKEKLKPDWISKRILPAELFSAGWAESEGKIMLTCKLNARTEALVSVAYPKKSVSSIEMEEILRLCSGFLSHCYQSEKLSGNENKYQKLYWLTERMHASMDKDGVLLELVSTLQNMYPQYLFYLFLSHDNDNDRLLDLPVKNLLPESDPANEKAMQAFLSGETVEEFDQRVLQTAAYIPLKGKQGIYGVLEVLINHFKASGETAEEISFISLLANTAGNALENAQLYEQSKRLIADLQLINETSHQLNKNLRLHETMTYMAEQISESFGGEEMCFVYTEEGGTARMLPGSTEFFSSGEGAKYLSFAWDKTKDDPEGLFIGNISLQIHDGRYLSMMAVPMIVSEKVRGLAIVLHHEPYFFPFETFKLLQSLIHHSTLALTNSMLREELEMLVRTDTLTRLYSRRHMDEKINMSMKADRQGTFILLDIDNFKAVNDMYGHQVGDEVLQQVALIIKENIRENDIGARWGGEELAIYLPHADLEAGAAVAKRIVEKVEVTTSPAVTVSCGVSWWSCGEEDSLQKVFKRADQALYLAKGSGKNKVLLQQGSKE